MTMKQTAQAQGAQEITLKVYVEQDGDATRFILGIRTDVRKHKQINLTTMELLKSDLQKIGHTAYMNDNGFLQIITDVNISGIEEILLRNILKLYGDYKITNVSDIIWKDGRADIELATNLPFELYETT